MMVIGKKTCSYHKSFPKHLSNKIEEKQAQMSNHKKKKKKAESIRRITMENKVNPYNNGCPLNKQTCFGSL